MTATKTRTGLYSTILAISCAQSIIAFFAGAFNGFSPYMVMFGYTAGAVSFLTWPWISVLLYFNNRPMSTHPLTRVSAHYISFVVYTVVWLVLGIMILTQTPLECNFVDPSDGLAYVWCPLSASAGIVAILISIFSAVTSMIIHNGAQKSGDLDGNIAHTIEKGTTILEGDAT